jgi:hypothetical protein
MLCEMVRNTIVRKKGYFRHALKDFGALLQEKNQNFLVLLFQKRTDWSDGGSGTTAWQTRPIDANHGMNNTTIFPSIAIITPDKNDDLKKIELNCNSSFFLAQGNCQLI